MHTQNTCYTYFKILGKFDPDDISSLLALTPERTCRMGEPMNNGASCEFAFWEFGRCAEYDVETDKQMQKTISCLRDKVSLLNRIRQKYDAAFFLEVVPTLYADDIAPCLAPSLEVIDFCHATRTEIDIDLYIASAAE